MPVNTTTTTESSNQFDHDHHDHDHDHHDGDTPMRIADQSIGGIGENRETVHRVRMPPLMSTAQKLRRQMLEIFFADDPLSAFKGRTPRQKALLGLQSVFHIFQWLPEYNLGLFRSDLIAGITISSLAIPQGINYAKLANLPPMFGLYSSFVPPLLYSILGSSKHLAVGPTSTASMVMGSMLGKKISYKTEPLLHLQLALTATFFAGLIQASFAIFRLGFVLDFLSKATLLGFMAGVAILVTLQQLKGMLGMVHFTDQMQLIPVVTSVFTHKKEWSGLNIAIGICILAFLLGAKFISLRKPKLFWIAAAAPLASVIVSTVFVFALQPKYKQVPKIGRLPNGINPPSSSMLYFHRDANLALAIETGIVTGLLSLTEAVAVGRTFASIENYQLDGNKEMMAIGAMNIAGSCCSCFITTGTFSRSAVNYDAGGKTAISNAIMAVVVLVTLLFLMPLFSYTPEVTLSAIIVVAVMGLIDVKGVINLWKLDKLDFFACACSLLGVLFLSVAYGLAIAIGVSILKVILHVTRPNTMVLGQIPGTKIYRSLHRYTETTRVDSFLILAIESPIFFTNSTYLQDRILRWVREEEERIQSDNGSPLKCVIVDLTAVTAIDTNGLDLIAELKKTLDKKSLEFVLVNPVASVMEKLHKSKVLESFEPKGLYLTVEEAVADISLSWEP